MLWRFKQVWCRVSEGSHAGIVLLTADHQTLWSLGKHSGCRTHVVPLRLFKSLKRSGDREAWLICVSCRGQYCLLRGDKNFERTLGVLLSQLHGNRISVELMLTAYNPWRRGREARLSAENKASVFYNGSDLTCLFWTCQAKYKSNCCRTLVLLIGQKKKRLYVVASTFDISAKNSCVQTQRPLYKKLSIPFPLTLFESRLKTIKAEGQTRLRLHLKRCSLLPFEYLIWQV